MTFVWIVIALLVIFFAWAGWALRKRSQSSGPESTADLQRRTGGFHTGAGGF